MTYKQFEELPVWNDAIDLALGVFNLTGMEGVRLPSGVRDQLERAAVSISNNIAEGFERGTNQELLAFLYIARGSAGEVRSMLHLLHRYEGTDRFQDHVSDLRARALAISRQLGKWAEHVKNSSYKGTRHRTESDRMLEQETRRHQEFLAHLDDIRKRANRSNPPHTADG